MSHSPVDDSDPAAREVTTSRARVEGATGELSVRSFPDLPGVELWTAKQWARSWSTYTWAYGFCALDRDPPADGQLSWRYRRATYATGRNSTMTLEPNEVHVTTHVSEPVNYHMMLVDPDRLASMAEETGLRDRHFREPHIDCPVAYERFQRLWAALEDTSAEPLERQGALSRYLTLLFARAGEAPPPSPAVGGERAVRRAREFIESNYAGRLSLDAVAEAAGVSKFHLERTFGTKVGMPVWEFVKHARVRRGLSFLRQGRRPAEVSTLVGFSDQAHMTRVFRELLGFTPGHYRRAYHPPIRPGRHL
jgi:AraC-like DNA-binding protein